MSGTSITWHAGGCHCGAVRFEVALPAVVEAQSCNCSMCAKTGFIHMIVPQSRFRLTRGAERLVEYTFNSRVAKHLFCGECGVEAFYRPRSNPDGWSVNARCLDRADDIDLRVAPFDGQNWEANAADLAHLSKEPA
ncbi:GFA family protein [Phenylobacterium sp.]|uniref:GFA family protein n=1 Tax=Phenylobacterium sp. TaxID=1871053 RepID=UPI00286CC069|nr:GFA family protein [Phenylobacterium sp.]